VIHQSISRGAQLVTAPGGPARTAETDQLGVLLSAVTGTAMLTLLAMVVISVFKPWGLTRRGRRVTAAAAGARRRSSTPADSPFVAA
jgi:hypothetical protein